MSQTLRIYWRDYVTGEVGLEGGYHYPPGMTWGQEWLKQAALEYASSVGVDPHEVHSHGTNGFHVISPLRHGLVGRFYFAARTPLDVSLGSDWYVIHRPGLDDQFAVFGFDRNDWRYRLRWRPMTAKAIERQHGNDDFGGFTEPVLTIFPPNKNGTEAVLGELPGDADAVCLMMMDAKDVMGGKYLLLRG